MSVQIVGSQQKVTSTLLLWICTFMVIRSAGWIYCQRWICKMSLKHHYLKHFFWLEMVSKVKIPGKRWEIEWEIPWVVNCLTPWPCFHSGGDNLETIYVAYMEMVVAVWLVIILKVFLKQSAAEMSLAILQKEKLGRLLISHAKSNF